MRFFFLTLFLLFPVSRSIAELGRYKIILDKQLLGRAAPKSVSTSPVSLPQPTPSWARQYRMTMMTQDQVEGTVRIGLQNVQDQSSVLLIEGKKKHPDFTLISANYVEGSAQISYRGATHRFDLESVATPTITSSSPKLPSPLTPSSRSPRSGSPRRASRNTTPSRREDSPTLQIRRFASQEELQEHLKEQQMDAIRTGKPPLPIPLTPEMDAQLVKEGVLPPSGNP